MRLVKEKRMVLLNSKKDKKDKKFQRLLDKGIIRVCRSCSGVGKIYGHGAFGESETYTCGRCGGDRYILNMDYFRVEND